MCTNITNITRSCSMETLQGLAYCPLLLLGLVVNAAALRASIAQRDPWTDTHVYIFNLVIADSALLFFLPFRIYDAFFCLSKTLLCTFLVSIHYINMYASIFTSTAISVHRYLAIKFPLQARSWRRKKKAAFAVCLAIWVFVVTICAVFWENNHPQKLWTCYERCRNQQLQLQFLVILVSVGFLTPLFIVVYCSGQIICVLLKEVTKSVETKRTIGIVTANMIVFVVCYTPIHIAFVVSYLSEPPPNWQFTLMPVQVYILLSEWIASTNCCFDSISYYFLLKRYYS
uniref:G-protein coupled receptor 35-like n=1 Tax=Semicossyphus pulcher TaxID=241346 RepID=UPI0037E72904